MNEEEIKDYREHLIKWIDIFLENKIIPQVINPKAIKDNYVKKSKMEDKIKNNEENIDNLYNSSSYGDRYVAERIDELKHENEVLKELLEEE